MNEIEQKLHDRFFKNIELENEIIAAILICSGKKDYDALIAQYDLDTINDTVCLELATRVDTHKVFHSLNRVFADDFL